MMNLRVNDSVLFHVFLSCCGCLPLQSLSVIIPVINT